jgi:hypothetical protein
LVFNAIGQDGFEMKRELRCETETVPAAVTSSLLNTKETYSRPLCHCENGKAPEVRKSEDLPHSKNNPLSGIKAHEKGS